MANFLVIIQVFKILRQYLKGCKYEIYIFANYNNLCRFLDIKSLSFRQICWAQELFQYQFRKNYYQDKVNKVAFALYRYPKQNAEKKVTLQAKNTKILHCLQFTLAKVSELFPSNLLPFHQI